MVQVFRIGNELGVLVNNKLSPNQVRGQILVLVMIVLRDIAHSFHYLLPEFLLSPQSICLKQ